MRSLITILLFPAFCYSQEPYVAKWNAIAIDSVQQSIDNSIWKTLAVVSKNQDTSIYTLPAVTAFIRIKSGNVTSKSVYMPVDIVYSSTILNPVFKTSWWYDNLSWTTTGESNVDFYLISKSTNGSSYSQVTKVTAKGNSNYNYSSSRWGKRPTYRITTFFKNGTSDPPINFR